MRMDQAAAGFKIQRAMGFATPGLFVFNVDCLVVRFLVIGQGGKETPVPLLRGLLVGY